MDIDKNINKITTKLNVESKHIYQHPILKPFIDCYLMQTQKHKYKLFGAYIFRFNYLNEYYARHEFKEFYCINDKLDFRKSGLKNQLSGHINYFIGYTVFGIKAEICPIFIHMHEADNMYFYTGYSIESSNDNYHYLYEDKKQIGYLKNIPIDIVDKYRDENPIIELSEKTKKNCLFN